MRVASVAAVRPDQLEAYVKLHDEIWPEIKEALRGAGIINYEIYHLAGMLFARFEYVGPPGEYEARIAALAEAPRMQEWWALTNAMTAPPLGLDERWATAQEVFYLP